MVDAAQLCRDLHVPLLAEHLALVLSSCVLFFGAQVASHTLAPAFFPRQFSAFSRRTRTDWDLHFTGWFHALISTPWTLWLIQHPSKSLVLDPIFAFGARESLLFAFSGGYFLYDLLISVWLVRSHGVPFVIHATACCFIFFYAFHPFLQGFGPMFLIWEFSTIFLHIHWWLDKLGKTGSMAQLINGVLLLCSFFCTRVAYGGYRSVLLWRTLDDPRVWPMMRWGFRAACIALNLLNWNWFRMMIASVARRFDSGDQPNKNKRKD